MLDAPTTRWETQPLPADDFDCLLRLLFEPTTTDAEFEAVAA